MRTPDDQIMRGRPWARWMHDLRCAMNTDDFSDARLRFSLARMNGAPEAEVAEWERLWTFTQAAEVEQ